MIIQYDPGFIEKLKDVNIRIRKAFREKIKIFKSNPHDLQLDNHALKKEYAGYRSINITSDWRAIYQEIKEKNNKVAYFINIGTHKELYTSTISN